MYNAKKTSHLSNRSQSNLSPMEVIKGIEQLTQRLIVVKGNDRLSKEAQSNATMLMKILLRSALSSRQVLETHRLTDVAFRRDRDALSTGPSASGSDGRCPRRAIARRTGDTNDVDTRFTTPVSRRRTSLSACLVWRKSLTSRRSRRHLRSPSIWPVKRRTTPISVNKSSVDWNIAQGSSYICRGNHVLDHQSSRNANVADHRSEQICPDRSFRSQEPVGSFMFRHVPCNRTPAGFSPDKFQRLSSRNRLECTGTDRNSSGEKPAGIRLQGTPRNIREPAGSDRVRTTWVADRRRVRVLTNQTDLRLRVALDRTGVVAQIDRDIVRHIHEEKDRWPSVRIHRDNEREDTQVLIAIFIDVLRIDQFVFVTIQSACIIRFIDLIGIPRVQLDSLLQIPDDGKRVRGNEKGLNKFHQFDALITFTDSTEKIWQRREILFTGIRDMNNQILHHLNDRDHSK